MKYATVMIGVLLCGKLYAMAPDIESFLGSPALPPQNEFEILMNELQKKYSITSDEFKAVLAERLSHVPDEEKSKLIKLLTKSRHTSSATQELIKVLVDASNTTADLMRKQSETSQKALQFTKIASATGAVVSVASIILSNLLNYYLTH